ncbi:MAG: CPBP family intramembrane metalloprotease [bacterium]|nr:CPBP family intramembrane metalloprotease [bacterium]
MRGRIRTMLIIATIFALPFALVWGGVVPVDLRRWLYAAAGVVAFGVVLQSGLSLRDLGFRWDNARAAALPYALFAIVGAAAIVAFALAVGRMPRAEWWLAPHFAYGIIIPISVAQEFFYRSMLVPLLQRLSHVRSFVIIVNAALFAFLHIIFPDPAIVLPSTFLAGVIFAWLWLRWPNIWIASATHIVLNAAFVLFCFGGFETSCIR